MSKVWVFNEEQLDRALASYIGADVATGDAVDKIKHFLNSGSASAHGLVMECNPKPHLGEVHPDLGKASPEGKP